MYVKEYRMASDKKSAKIVQGEATTHKLVATARQLFSQHGYAGVSTETIVQQAEVTRGALYHHFSGKRELFLAVFEDVQREIAGRIEAAAVAAPDLWAGLLSGCRAFLEACIDPHLQQIVIIDAPAVLGWEVWRRVDADHGLNQLRIALIELMAAGLIKRQPLDALTHLLAGAMNEAALWIAQSPNPAAALEEAMATLALLLQALRTD